MEIEGWAFWLCLSTNDFVPNLLLATSTMTDLKNGTEPVQRSQSIVEQEQLQQLKEENQLLRVVLSAIGAAAIPALTEMLSHSDWRLRAGAVSLLCNLDPFPEAAVPVLLEAMQDGDSGVRSMAGYSLEHYFNPQPWMRRGRCCKCAATPTAEKPDQEPFLRALMGSLGDADSGVRVMAVGLLGRLGDAAKPALSLVKERLNDNDERVRYYAQQALVQIDPEAAVRAGVIRSKAEDTNSG